MIRQCLILAGGEGSRLRPVWDGPKTLVPVKRTNISGTSAVTSEPFARLQLDWLAKSDVWEVVYCAGQHARAIQNVFGATYRGMRLRYSEDADQGTAAALAHALRTGAMADAFFVLYGDALPGFSPQDMTAFGQGEDAGAPIVMAIAENRHLLQPSNCRVEGLRVVEYGEGPTMTHVDVGISVLRRERVETWMRDDPHLGPIFSTLARHDCIEAHEVRSRPHHVGDPQALAELESSFALR